MNDPVVMPIPVYLGLHGDECPSGAGLTLDTPLLDFWRWGFTHVRNPGLNAILPG